MHSYALTTPTDESGQHIRLFRRNFENNIRKSIDQLSGICSGILADGLVTDTEALFFADYVQKFASYQPAWPFTDILARVQRIFSDGICDEEEREELKLVMEALCGHEKHLKAGETYSSTLPFDSPFPTPIAFPGRNFVVTGKFAFGSRSKVISAIEDRGGNGTASPPRLDTHYLVVGLFASRDWAFTNYGRKIERAVELRNQSTGMAIISEQHWKEFIA